MSEILEKIRANEEVIKIAVKALRPVMNSWKTSCINAKGEPNIEFLAEFEMNLAELLDKERPSMLESW